MPIAPNIGRPVAIKTIQFNPNHKPEDLERLRERLFREARSAGGLSHPGIVTIYDVDQQDDLAYIAMEYVDGPTLDQVLSEPRSMTPARMFSILAQTAVAMDYAHSKGIVHRDIKPANIMIAANDAVKITDFGIAKIATFGEFTMTGSIVGTPHYMSPEQVQGHGIDGRSDQFSLAVIAFEMLTGEKPYTGENLTTVAYKIVAEEPVPPHRLNPTLTGAIEGVMRKALAKRPDGRYRTCREFVDALESAGATMKGWKLMPRAGMLNEPTVLEAAAAPGAASSTGPATLPPPRRPSRSAATSTGTGAQGKSGFFKFLIAMLVVAGLLGLIGWQVAPWLLPTRSARRPVPPPEIAQAPGKLPGDPLPPGDAKPSPMSPAPGGSAAEAPAAAPTETKSLAEPQSERPAQPAALHQAPAALRETRAAASQEVMVVSSPSGATARLVGSTTASCFTPCSLTVAPGRHTVALELPGYQTEYREVTVRAAPLELPPLTLRAAGGTLMLATDPVGASVTVDGRRVDGLTPVRIPLSAGMHEISVEKNGRQSSERIQIGNGINYRKILLDQ
jgi:serine/threonine-protein kinase